MHWLHLALTAMPDEPLSEPVEHVETTRRARTWSTSNPAPEETARPRFLPQHVETSRSGNRNRKVACSAERADASTGHRRVPRQPAVLHSELLPTPSDALPDGCFEEALTSQASYEALSRHAPRTTSFAVPHLDPIESSESNDSNRPSPSTSPSADSDDGHSHKYLRPRRSSDSRFSGQLLAIASRVAEKHLKEQSILQAAYVNETTYHPVDHFAVDRESELSEGEAELGGFSTGVGKNTRALRGEMKHCNASKQEGLSRRISAQRASQNAAKTEDAIAEPATSGSAKPISPPILGGDIVFPWAVSPQHTRFDVTQRPCARSAGQAKSRQQSGLWTGDGHTSRPGSGGLWHGCCAARGKHTLEVPNNLQTGLMTPRFESDGLQAPHPVGSNHQLPAVALVSEEVVLYVEQSIEHEVDDAFVTQIYNYLSLGYPALARKFDHELSKISKIPVEEIRRDDGRKNTKGFVAPEGSGPDENGVKRCSRWISLRLYCLEWARQHPMMAEVHGESTVGATARRGSWAL